MRRPSASCARSRGGRDRAVAEASDAGPDRRLGERRSAHVRHTRDRVGRGAGDLCRLSGQVAGRARAAARRASSPSPSRSRAGATCTPCSSELLRRLGGPVTRRASLPTRSGSSSELLRRAGRRRAIGSRAARGGADGARCGRSRPTCAATWSTRRPTAATGSRRRSSCGSASTTRTESLPPLALGEGGRVLVARRGRSRRCRPRRQRPCDRARLQERRGAPRAAGRTLGHRPPAPGGAVHARGARAARRSSRSAASTSRSAAVTCAPAGVFLKGAPVGRSVVGQRRPRPRGARRRCSRTPAERAVALAARLRAGELTPCPQTCSRDGCRYPGICRASDVDRSRRRSRRSDRTSPTSSCGDRAARRRAAARRGRRQRQDLGAGRAVRRARCSRTAIDVAAILTITFTEKAAAELRDRIRTRLRELGADDAARATEGAFISTIHGFCARVLRAARAGRRDRPGVHRARPSSSPSGSPTRRSTTRWRSSPRAWRAASS